MKKYFCDICSKEMVYDDWLTGRLSRKFERCSITVSFPPSNIKDVCEICTTDIFKLLDNFLLNTQRKINDNP